jgi:hypothetical protein
MHGVNTKKNLTSEGTVWRRSGSERKKKEKSENVSRPGGPAAPKSTKGKSPEETGKTFGLNVFLRHFPSFL